MNRTTFYAFQVLAMLGVGVQCYDGQEVLVVDQTMDRRGTYSPPRSMWVGPQDHLADWYTKDLGLGDHKSASGPTLRLGPEDLKSHPQPTWPKEVRRG